MARTKKLVCHDCNNIFNRKPANGNRQVCWKCQSLRVTGVDDPAPAAAPATAARAVPPAPVLRMAPPVAGGGLTAKILQDGRAALKKVAPVPVVLPGAPNTAIPRGIRVLAHSVKSPIIYTSNDPAQSGIVNQGVLEFDFPWRDRNGNQYHAYTILPAVDLRQPLKDIASGILSPAHGNANTQYRNKSLDLPSWKRTMRPNPWIGVRYREYGWRRNLPGNTRWGYYMNGQRYLHDQATNGNINWYLINRQGGNVFCERIIIAETGEVFYSPDHYCTFFRYHPGTLQWHCYSAAASPSWDESYYEEPRR